MKSIKLTPTFVRRYPDPINRSVYDDKLFVEHIIAICQAINLPEMDLEPNPRAQNPNKGIYKEVKRSLELEDDPTFLLKNRGITVIAQDVILSEDKKQLEVILADGDGIIDGGHTYRIIRDGQADGGCPRNQYVRVEILIGLPDYLKDAIAEGLNTSVQVQSMSMANKKGQFDWIKNELKIQPYVSEIAFKQNEEGTYDVRTIVAFMTLFNIDLYSESSANHPKVAYTSKEKSLEQYLENIDSFKKLAPLLPDILKLHDMVHRIAPELYNKKYKGKAGKLAFIKRRKRGSYRYIFLGEEGLDWVFDGALYPILGAFRYLVEQKQGQNQFSWKFENSEQVQRFFKYVAGDLINITKNTSNSKARNPNAIGKDDNHWAFLYQTVAFAYMQDKK